MRRPILNFDSSVRPHHHFNSLRLCSPNGTAKLVTPRNFAFEEGVFPWVAYNFITASFLSLMQDTLNLSSSHTMVSNFLQMSYEAFGSNESIHLLKSESAPGFLCKPLIKYVARTTPDTFTVLRVSTLKLYQIYDH